MVVAFRLLVADWTDDSDIGYQRVSENYRLGAVSPVSPANTLDP